MSTVQNEKTMFGQLIKKSRLKNGWSLCDVEEKTGITPSYLNRLERGLRRNPTASLVYALAKAYSVEVTTLVELILLDQEGEKDHE